MLMLPFGPLIAWLVGLLSLAIAGFGLYFVIGWFLGVVTTIALLWTGIGMLVFSLLGRYLVLLLIGSRNGEDEPKMMRSEEVQRLARPDGTELQVEFFGPANARTIIFTHGIGANSTDWYYAKRHLGNRYRLITWDIRGVGKSSRSPKADYSMEAMASDLAAVVELCGNQAPILVGHSMGGMITLTFCKLFPQYLGSRVAGLVLTNTTYTNPVKTTTARKFVTAIHRPVFVPLLYLIIGLSPVVWLQTWLSYLNGTSHIPGRIFTFAGRQTRGQLDFMALLSALCSPAVLARQMMAMFHYDATETLNRLRLPVLIVTSDTDRGCIPEASQYMHSQIPGSELNMIEHCGHGSIMEKNQDFTAAVDAFAARVSGTRRSEVA